MPEIPAVVTLTWAWPTLLTAIAVVVTAFVNQPKWSVTAKKVVTVIVAAIVGTIYAFVTGRIPNVPAEAVTFVMTWLTTIAVIIVFGKSAFEFFKGPITWVETKTSPKVEPEVTDEPVDGAEVEDEPEGEVEDEPEGEGEFDAPDEGAEVAGSE